MSRDSSTLEIQGQGRMPRPRAGWVVVLCLVGVGVLGAAVLATAWMLGGRTSSQAGAAADLLIGEEEAQLSSSGEGRAVSSAQPAVGTQDSYLLDEGPKILPGAPETTVIHDVPVEDLDRLKPLGWNLPQLAGFGLNREHAETGAAGGVRTVQVQFAGGDSWANVAETRSEVQGDELLPLEEKLTRVLDFDAVEHEELQLSTGDAGELYVAEGRWTAAVDTERAQYVITSNMPRNMADQVAGWVMVTDRSRVQSLPGEEPGGFERLQRGFQEMLPWL